MTYATQSDLTTRFSERELVQLTDRADVPTGAIDAARVTRALEEADNIIQSYIGVRYALPLASVPALLVDLACDIARFKLYDTGATEEVRTRYEDAIARLKALSKGEAVLDAAGIEPEGRDDLVFVDPGERLFSRDKMRGL
ncbi:MAG: DUF1320 domain-containing protein [Parvibaculum sedimenti]|uniref:gp436 family protein n=1 Tax=Parvibaculum sedimenti TaxID=2608632 RepID=UPI003BB5202B